MMINTFDFGVLFFVTWHRTTVVCKTLKCVIVRLVISVIFLSNKHAFSQPNTLSLAYHHAHDVPNYITFCNRSPTHTLLFITFRSQWKVLSVLLEKSCLLTKINSRFRREKGRHPISDTAGCPGGRSGRKCSHPGCRMTGNRRRRRRSCRAGGRRRPAVTLARAAVACGTLPEPCVAPGQEAELRDLLAKPDQQSGKTTSHGWSVSGMCVLTPKRKVYAVSSVSIKPNGL